jgi:uncharacterized metal-binding protein
VPSGKTHDLLIKIFLPFVIVAGSLFEYCIRNKPSYDVVPYAIIYGCLYMISGYTLSPDLDRHSTPYNRWGYFKWYWRPYQKVIKHRSPWSHWIILGTAIRLIYILWIPVVVLLICGVDVFKYIKLYWIDIVAIFIVMDLASAVHIVSDYVYSGVKKRI